MTERLRSPSEVARVCEGAGLARSDDYEYAWTSEGGPWVSFETSLDDPEAVETVNVERPDDTEVASLSAPVSASLLLAAIADARDRPVYVEVSPGLCPLCGRYRDRTGHLTGWDAFDGSRRFWELPLGHMPPDYTVDAATGWAPRYRSCPYSSPARRDVPQPHVVDQVGSAASPPGAETRG